MISALSGFTQLCDPADAARGLRVHALPGLEDAELLECWRELESRPPASISASPEWVLAAFRQIHGTAQPLVLAVTDRQRIVGLLPMVSCLEGDRAVVRFVGAPFNDLNDALVRPGFERQVAMALVGRLKELSDAGVRVVLEDVDPDGVLAMEGETLDWVSASAAPTVGLGGAWTRASPRRRKEWRRVRRQLERRHGVAVRATTGKHVTGEIPGFLQLRRLGLEAKSRSVASPPFRFVEDVVAGLAPIERCQLLDLLVDGVPVARDLYLIDRKTAMLWIRALDPAWKRYGCGHQLLEAGARIFEDAGFQALDLGRGDETYKYKFGADDRVLVHAAL